MSDNGASAENLFELPEWKQLLDKPFFGTFIDEYQTAGGDTYSLASEENLMPGPKDRFQMIGREWAQLSNTPFRIYKTWVPEGGIASPLIVHWVKGLSSRAGALVNDAAHVIDIMPTIRSIVSAQDSLIQDGINLLDSLNGKSLPERIIFF
jgi:arylsulfatase A-like enzyme